MPIYPRRDYFESIFDHYKDLSGYFTLPFTIPNNAFKTDEAISLISGKNFELTKKEITQKFGVPRAKFRIRKDNLAINIYIFNLTLGEYPVRLEVHMNRNVLFYFKYSFSATINITKEDRLFILQIIKEKYLHKGALIKMPQTIFDKNQTLLQIVDDVNFEISYINLRSAALQELSNHRITHERNNIYQTERRQQELIESL